MEAPSLPRLSLVTSWCVVTRDIAHRPGRGACSSELGRAPEMALPAASADAAAGGLGVGSCVSSRYPAGRRDPGPLEAKRPALKAALTLVVPVSSPRGVRGTFSSSSACQVGCGHPAPLLGRGRPVRG